MKIAGQGNSSTTTSFVVEIDGEIKSQYGIFLEALKAGMELKRKFPQSQIRVHEADKA
jgi:hypothetical protein